MFWKTSIYVFIRRRTVGKKEAVKQASHVQNTVELKWLSSDGSFTTTASFELESLGTKSFGYRFGII